MRQLVAHPTSAARWLGFLSDEMRNCESGDANLRHIAALLDRPSRDIEATFVAANLMALLLFRARRLDEARALCHREIGHALAGRGTARWPALALYALQPQVNLFRLDGHAGDLDAALRGLDALDQLAGGRPAAFPDLELDAGTVGAIRDRGFDLPAFARGVRVVETCKVLWSRGSPERLRDQCREFQRRWPDLAARGGPAHASEAAWLLGDDAAEVRDRVDSAPSLRRRRLELVRWLHAAAHAAQSGRVERAAGMASALVECRGGLQGPYASAVTPLRRDASLADTLLRSGCREAGAALIAVTLDALAPFSDPVLRDGLCERARLLGMDPPAEPDAGPELQVQLARVLDRLDEGR